MPRTHAIFGSRTDVGCVRERNEDSLAVSPPLFVPQHFGQRDRPYASASASVPAFAPFAA